jgi:hypothetical protein
MKLQVVVAVAMTTISRLKALAMQGLCYTVEYGFPTQKLAIASVKIELTH